MTYISEGGKITFFLLSKLSCRFGVETMRAIIVLICVLSVGCMTFSSQHEVHAAEQDSSRSQQQESTADKSDGVDVLDGTADEMERYEKDGLTILIGQVRIKRPNGFLNADKVIIYENVETGDTTKTVAEGNVEIRDEDIFATCEHAILNHIDDTVDLRDNVVVIQEEDLLEAKHFTFNRRTGKQTGDGGVKFKVRMKQSKKQTEVAAEEER